MSHDAHAHEESHVVEYGVFVLVWLALLTLTAITVTAAGVHLGKGNVWVAIGIATIKVFLVMSFFMHLKYENRILRLMVSLAVLILGIILVLTFVDTTLW